MKKAYLFVSPLCEHHKATSRSFKKVFSELGYHHEVINEDSKNGSLFAQCYGVKETPTLMFIQEDGKVIHSEQKEQFSKNEFIQLGIKYLG